MWLGRSSVGIALLLQLLAFSKALYEGCDHTYTLQANSVAYLQSPYYPYKYPSGTSCRYNFVAPLDSEIVAECTMNIDKGPTACSTEYFYISREGDPNLRGADQFCGSGTITRTSLFRKITFAYVSAGTNGVGGRFVCKLTTRPQSCDCGWSQTTRIVGGQETAIGEFPAMVGLYHIPTKTVYCGGAIINHRTIVTAAHCVRIHPVASEVLIVAGDHDLSSDTESNYAATYRVSRFFVNPNYNSTTESSDIALIITATDIEWSRGVGPICLPLDQQSNSFTNDNVNIVGWGTTSFTGSRSNTLQKASVNILSNSACQAEYPDLVVSQMCTYFPNRDSCQFDSGGPVVHKGAIREFLLGVISYGNACALGPGVNTRITSFINWIRSNAVGGVCQKPFV